jgi:hypothetical protein
VSKVSPNVELRRALLAHLAGDLAAAEASYHLALADPALAEAARFHLARLLERAGRWEDAIAERRALLEAFPANPDYRLALAQSLLALGRYAEGWPLFEARRELPAYKAPIAKVGYPEWDGGPVRSLLVWDEEGIGDAIQFARFPKLLKDRGVDVTLVSRPPLADLMGELGVRVIRAEGLTEVPQADAWVMLASIPGKMGVTVETLPSGPYLGAPAGRRETWARCIGPGIRIGVVARGNPQQSNDANRSLDPEARTFLHSLPGAIPLTPEDFPLPLADFADTAAVIAALDLVIGVDTAVTHLAGAMGKPCWLLLSSGYKDWRWMYDRADSPWYPSMRIYRQPTRGDWASALRQVALDLPRFLGQA